MPIITLSREYGAGGLEVGQFVARELGADCVDSRLISEVARRLELPEEWVERWDERREGLAFRMLRALQSAHPEYAPVAGATGREPDPDHFVEVVRDVMLEEARSGNAVFVGRGGAFLLREHPGALHVRLVASRGLRVERIEARSALSREEALRRVEKADRERIDWVRHHFEVDPTSPLHYAMILNTGLLGVEGAARSILGAAARHS